MKRTGKVLAILLALAMLLSVAAFATDTTPTAWPVYGGNNHHTNNVETSAPTGPVTTTTVNLQGSGSGWTGVDNVPVMQTVNGTTYAYVLYDGHSAGCTLTKVNCNTGTIVWEAQLESTSGFQLSTPLLVQGNDANSETDDVIFAASNSGSIYRISGLGATSASGVQPLKIYTVSAGQINTPITYNNGYIYFGTWIGNGTIEGSTAPGRYYQMSLSDFSVQSVSSIKRGFYWAGAVVLNNYVYFGGDDGYLFYRPAGSGFGTTSDNDIKSSCVLLTDEASDAGNVRSTISTDGTYLYFTSQGKYLWCYKPVNNVPVFQWKVALAGTSTSTPTVVTSDTTTDIYTGYYNGFSDGGVQVTSYAKDGTPTTASEITSGFPVQSSILYYDGYLYFNTNSSDGAGYCYNTTDGQDVWTAGSETYALGGMAILDGYAVFGNDHNYLYVVKNAE